MSDEMDMTPSSTGDEKSSPPAMIPYERFAEVNRQLKEAKAQLASLSQEMPMASENNDALEAIFQRMMTDPEGYLSELIGQVMQHELMLIREEAALKSALNYAQKRYPEFKSFEKYIMKELSDLLQNNPETDSLSWDELLDKGVEQMQARLQEAMKQGGDPSGDSPAESAKAYFEGQASRQPQPAAATFTRDQIAKMSLSDFMANESAINDALRNNRIR